MFRNAQNTARAVLAIFFLWAATHASAITVTKSSIQKMSGWSSCTVCAGPGGSGSVATMSATQHISSPSLSGGSMRFSIGGTKPYAAALWWKQLGADNSKTHFVYDLSFYLQTPGYAQALEFDVNQSNGTRKFIFGTQCNIKGGHHWDVYDPAGHAWHSTGIYCPTPSAFKWHHLVWEVYRDSSHVHYVSVTLDGAKHYVNRSYTARSASAKEINVAFQMDGDSHMDDYKTWLDNVKLTYW